MSPPSSKNNAQRDAFSSKGYTLPCNDGYESDYKDQDGAGSENGYDSDGKVDASVDREVVQQPASPPNQELGDSHATENGGWSTVLHRGEVGFAKRQARRNQEAARNAEKAAKHAQIAEAKRIKAEARAKKYKLQEAERQRLKAIEAEERYEARMKAREERKAWERELKRQHMHIGLDDTAEWFRRVLDDGIVDEELPTVVTYDTESALGYTDGEKAQVLTELGLTIVPLWIVRKYLRVGYTFLQAWAETTTVVHLRIVEHAKWQIACPYDRHGDRLWQSCFHEFGKSYWVHLEDFAEAIVKCIDDVTSIEYGRDSSYDEKLGKLNVKDSNESGARCGSSWDAAGAPNGENTKHKIILVGHAVHNDEIPLAELGFAWYDHYNIVLKIDTQTMAWDWACTDQKPGLKKLCDQLGIAVVRRHHGANDSAYTAFVYIAVALVAALNKDLFHMAQDPEKVVGGVVNQIRTKHYEESSTDLIDGKQVCNTCGLESHDKLVCRRRCLYCGERRIGTKSHNYVDCPHRLKDEKDWEPYNEPSSYRPRILALSHYESFDGQKKSFIMSEHDRLRLYINAKKLYGPQRANQLYPMSAPQAASNARKSAPRPRKHDQAVWTTQQR